MFIYQPQMPEHPTFAPNFDSIERDEAGAAALWDATRDLQLFRDNANAEDTALAEAYERRNRAIFEATGVQLSNPRRDFSEADMQEAVRAADSGADPWEVMRRREEEWQAEISRLAREKPEHAAAIAASRAIQEDAFAITREAEARFGEANEAAAGLPALRRFGNVLGGGISGMLRDPLQIAALTLGGGLSPARTVFGRVLSTMFTEAAVNAGVEGAVQVAAQDYKRRAGVQHGLSDALADVGIAALFGGGFGGLVAGGAEVFRLTGKAVPPEALARAAQGTPEPGDARIIAESLGLKLDRETEAVAELAASQQALDQVAFGEPPGGLSDAASEALAASAVRSIEEPADTLPRVDLQERVEAIDRIVRQQQPLGPAPPKPVSLFPFLASRAVGGLRDDGGELAAMGLSRKFVPGGGALVRKNGKQLDMAREAAAEAGYFDHIYGDPDRAVAESTVDDLLRLLRQEAGGEPAYSARNDGGRQFEWLAYEQRQAAQEAYRQLLGRIDSAADEFGLDRLDDAIIVRAAELVDNETDEIAALERALEEDYRSYEAALSERGEGFSDEPEYDIPFFDVPDAGAGPPPGRDAGAPRDVGRPPGRGADEAPGEQFPAAGRDEGSPPLRTAGETPEPGTPEAGELAEATLVEVRGASEQTPAGEQTLLEGVKPVTTKERLEAQGKKPLRGGDKAPPEGGLFDEGARQQIDMWDAIPAARTADGEVSHVTHAELVENAERDDFFGDLIKSCKD